MSDNDNDTDIVDIADKPYWEYDGWVNLEPTLVCEGACNPDIHDYDQAASRIGPSDYRRTREIDARQVQILYDWVRRLVHTHHECIRTKHWSKSGHGWVRSFRCTVCGHVREF